MRAGHGFHFLVPGRPLPTFLDILARPPRVGSFGSAERRARRIRTDWGILPVVHPVDLVEIKKTRRLADYDIITNLVLLYLAEIPSPNKAVLRWAADNCYRPEERAAIFVRLGQAQTIDECAHHIAKEVLQLQSRDRAYWRPIIDELRKMRREGTLLAEGMPVSRLS
jgi:hypothetical protein